MLIAAVLCIGIGVYPAALYSLLPYDTGYNPYDATHVLAQTQLLFFSALAFVWLNLKGMYPPELHSTNLDVEWFYRRLFPVAIQSLFAAIWRLDDVLRRAFVTRLHRCLDILSSIYHVPTGLLTSARPAGSMAMWVAIFLAGYLFLSFVY